MEIDLDYISRRVIRKLEFSGFSKDVYFEVLGGSIVSLSRHGEWCVVYVKVSDIFDKYRKAIDSVIDYLRYDIVYFADISYSDISLRKIKVEHDISIIEKCKKYMRLLSSISEGQWFDHIRSREKFHGRATVDLIRVIRVLEEMQVVEPVWRKWGMGSQHTLKVKKKLSKGELAYYLLRLLNVAVEKSLKR